MQEAGSNQEWILVVDDDPQVVTLLAQMLAASGYRADASGSSREALAAMRENAYTIVLTDICMPEMDGIELMKCIRDKYPDVLCVAMTGYVDRVKYLDVINAGAADFINKPIEMEELAAKFERVIRERSLRHDLKRLSVTDDLTGLFNRRHFSARLRDEIIRAQRQDHRLSLILLDLDGFKKYNDTKGHPNGDRILQQVGEIVRSKVRSGVDTVFRYGGDEFAVVLPEADGGVCGRIIERIKMTLWDDCRMLISAGHASLVGGMTPEAFLETADRDLYVQKRTQ